MIRFSDGTELESVSVYGGKMFFELEKRSYLDITVTGCTYETVQQYFVDGASFSVVEDGETFDKSEYNIAGDITDHRNGQFTVRMSAKNEREVAMDTLEKENAILLFETVTGGEWVE